jgi:two-component system cell cycle sensor histidine kinase/response regulator CckA
MNMLTRTRKWLAPPVFEDEDKTRTASLLNTILLSTLAIEVLVAIIIPFYSPLPVASFSVLVIVALPTLGALYAVRMGRVRLVSSLYVSAVWVLDTLLISVSGGVRGPAASNYILLTAMVGLLLGGRAALSCAGVSLLSGLAMVYADSHGLLPTPVIILANLVTDWAAFAANLSLAGGLLYLATRDIDRALERARRNERALTESNRELQAEIAERMRTEEERKQLLVRIREQARRVQQIMDTVPEGVLLLNSDWQVVLANPLGEEQLLILAGAEVGDSLTQLASHPLAELLTSPPTKGLWHEIAADGRSFQVIARPLESGPGSEDWVMVIREVTQEREIEQRVHQQERLAAVGQLAAGVAHDFNNIMAAIVLYAQMTARMSDLPDHVREWMKTIDRQANHATNLIQQILDFSRRTVLEQRPLDLALFLKEQVQLLERTLPENITIGLDCGIDEYMVHADPTRIQQMVMNLALNARDAMPEGGGLRVGLERTEIEPGKSPPLPEMRAGEWIRVTVSDTGTGIPPDVLPHVFDPFFTTKESGKGTGLGLAQVHGIVGAHEGHIDVQSQVGQGTVFTIYLPALLAHPSETPTQAPPSLVEGRGEIILVVEDNAATRGALVGGLELLNYGVLEAANGREALMMLEQHSEEIALILSDVVMPELGGIALLRVLRERGLSIPVVMLTGHPLEREMEDLRAQGMTDWLPKPSELEQLAEVVARALGTD